MDKAAAKQASRIRRHARIRARVSGTSTRPRLAVFRSNRYIYAQLIDDTQGVTVAAADSRAMKGKTMVIRAGEVGRTLGDLAQKKGIKEVVFDRGGFTYQGVIAALADGARGSGLTF